MDGLLRRYTFKLYPNVAQGAALEQQRRLHSALYNALIEQRIDAYRRGDAYERALGKKQGKRGGVTLTAFDQGKEVTRLRAADPEYNALSRGSMEQTCKRVDLAFEAFFKRAKGGAGASSGFPRFKRCDGFGFREQSHGGWDFVDNHLRLQGVVGTIRARGRFPGEPREVRTCDLRLTGDACAADALELATLNGGLGAQHPSGRWWTYSTPMDGAREASAHAIVFQARPGTPELNCCSVNGPRVLGMLSEWAVMSASNGLVWNWLGAGRFTAQLPSGVPVNVFTLAGTSGAPG